jgi:WhiB family redox-sensing transcriptional regulator
MSSVEQLAGTRPPRLWADAACRDLPADWFHPARGETTSEARAVCAACTVRADCLRWAITNNERFGVWGGTSERERRRIKRRLAGGQPTPELDPDWIPADRTGHRLTVPVPPPPTEEPMELVTASPAPATTNGARPIDPDTGLPTDVCVNCGKRYTPKRHDQRFHTKECARAWYASHPRDENGQRAPRIRKARATARRPIAASVAPVPTPAPAAPGPVEALLGQVLAGSDRWHVEADLGDVHITISRGRTAR